MIKTNMKSPSTHKLREALGLLNMDAYASKNHEKLALYEQNGILLGDTLMISLETADCPLNTAAVRKRIEAILK